MFFKFIFKFGSIKYFEKLSRVKKKQQKKQKKTKTKAELFNVLQDLLDLFNDVI